VRLIELELWITGVAYLMSAVPVAGVVIAGRVSPLYRLPAADLRRWWSWSALALAVALLAQASFT
jgi:hypothetical protein